jgi:integrase
MPGHGAWMTASGSLPLAPGVHPQHDVGAPLQAILTYDVPCERIRRAVHGRRFRQLVLGRCNEAELKHCSFHGLRKAAATRLIDAGCDVVEAAAITGHASLKELQRYIETRDRKKAARRAMGKLISGTEVANTNIRLANQEKKA